MLKEKLRKHKFSLIVILIIAVAFAAVYGTISGRAEAVSSNPIKQVNENRSQVLVFGEKYALNHKQEKDHKEEQKRKAKQIKEQEKQDNNVERRMNEKKQESDDGKSTESDKGETATPGDGTGDSSNEEENPKPDEDESEEPPESGDNEEISKIPRIITNLKDGQEVNGLRVKFTVEGRTYLGYKIESFNFDVKVNGVKIYSAGKDTYKRTYTANLNDGANEVEITIKDDDGNTVTNYYKVYANKDGPVKVGGTVTVTLDTRTIGLGYKFVDTSEFNKDDNIADVIIRALEKNGYGYVADQNTSYGWYLPKITKPGITNGAKIPDPIKEKLDDMGATEGIYKNDSLAAGDFYKDAGWVYLLNNEYAGTGMANISVDDGDEIVVAFTLCMGFEYDGTWFNGSW